MTRSVATIGAIVAFGVMPWGGIAQAQSLQTDAATTQQQLQKLVVVNASLVNDAEILKVLENIQKVLGRLPEVYGSPQSVPAPTKEAPAGQMAWVLECVPIETCIPKRHRLFGTKHERILNFQWVYVQKWVETPRQSVTPSAQSAYGEGGAAVGAVGEPRTIRAGLRERLEAVVLVLNQVRQQPNDFNRNDPAQLQAVTNAFEEALGIMFVIRGLQL